MDKNNFLKKILAVGTVILFIGINPLTAAKENKTGKNASLPFENIKTKFQIISNKGAPIPLLFGDMGNNGWYISEVSITFQYDPSVKEIYYRIGDEWIKYTGQFTVSEDGVHFIPWYWIDRNGTIWREPPLEFKIDKTPPTIKLTKKSGSNDQVTFTATTTDATSGIERVEFYLDDELQQTDYDTPYQYIWIGTTTHMVYAISYNYAGLSEKSNTLNTPRIFQDDLTLPGIIPRILFTKSSSTNI